MKLRRYLLIRNSIEKGELNKTYERFQWLCDGNSQQQQYNWYIWWYLWMVRIVSMIEKMCSLFESNEIAGNKNFFGFSFFVPVVNVTHGRLQLILQNPVWITSTQICRAMCRCPLHIQILWKDLSNAFRSILKRNSRDDDIRIKNQMVRSTATKMKQNVMIMLTYQNQANHSIDDYRSKDFEKERYALQFISFIHHKWAQSTHTHTQRDFAHFWIPFKNINQRIRSSTKHTSKYALWFLFSFFFLFLFSKRRVLCCCRHCSTNIIRKKRMHRATGLAKLNSQILSLNAEKLVKWLYWHKRVLINHRKIKNGKNVNWPLLKLLAVIFWNFTHRQMPKRYCYYDRISGTNVLFWRFE